MDEATAAAIGSLEKRVSDLEAENVTLKQAVLADLWSPPNPDQFSLTLPEHYADCAMHNAPALEPKRCDCHPTGAH